MSDSANQVILRLPTGVKPALQQSAKENYRSLNREAAYRLEESLRRDGRLPDLKEAA